VEDLVPPAGRVAVRQRPQDALAGQTVDDAAQRSLFHARIAREVVDSVRDLGSRRSDQVVEERRGRLFLLIVESGQRALEVLLNDPFGAAEFCERRAPERRSVAVPLDVPQALEDELEVRGLDPLAALLGLYHTASGEPVVDPPGPDLVEERLHEFRLGRVALAAEPLVLLERADDRRAARLAIEVVEPEVVREQPGNPRLEGVQRRERIITHAEEHVDAQIRSVHYLGERVEEPVVAVAAVVEEVLLQLVEDQVEVAAELRRPVAERVGEGGLRRWRFRGLIEQSAYAGLCGCSDSRARLVAPRAEDDDPELRRPADRHACARLLA